MYGRRYRRHFYDIPRTYYPQNQVVVVGNLSDDFLRIDQIQAQEQLDRAAAMQLQNQIPAPAHAPNVGRLQITIVSAVLTKNYGITRMDPFVRLRVGHQLFETPTDINGAKNPRWNKMFQVYQIPIGTNTFMHVEIFDERTISDDERIAWANITVPQCVYQGEVVDSFYPLNGKLGEGMEGTINIVMSFSTAPVPAPPAAQYMVMSSGGYYSGYPGYTTVPVYTLPQPVMQTQILTPGQPYANPPPPVQIVIRPEDITQLREMFPSVEVEVVQSVLEASSGNKEVAINALLQMQDSWGTPAASTPVPPPPISRRPNSPGSSIV